MLRAVRYFGSVVFGAGVRDKAQILWGKVVMHSRRSAGAIAPAARKIIKRLSPERKLDSTESLREIIYQEGNKNKCLVSERGGEREREDLSVT
jgi:hypothetical protein